MFYVQKKLSTYFISFIIYFGKGKCLFINPVSRAFLCQSKSDAIQFTNQCFKNIISLKVVKLRNTLYFETERCGTKQ